MLSNYKDEEVNIMNLAPVILSHKEILWILNRINGIEKKWKEFCTEFN